MEESTFSHFMILVAVIGIAGFIYLMERIDKRFMKEEQK
ncbi:preprotein translocase subunit YajC [Bacillus sp. RC218]